MNVRSCVLAAAALFAAQRAVAQRSTCAATPTSMTPAGWASPRTPDAGAPRGRLTVVADIPLPGPANRFDYESVDPIARRLYISHMDAGQLVVFDLDASRVVGEVAGVDGATGVRAVPALHMIYVSATGLHEIVGIDDRTLAINARIAGARFPDGIAYAPAEQRLFVSDESGGADVVIDAATNERRAIIALGGEAGNTQYDSVSHCILVAVQTRNQLVAIDPASDRIVARYDLPSSDRPHGFALDEPGRLAFVSCEGNARLLLVDLRTMKVVATYAVGGDPDVLAWDPAWRSLYVASESGVVSVFDATRNALRLVEELHAPHAHSVAVDPKSHRVYLPLENLHGRPVLRVLRR